MTLTRAQLRQSQAKTRREQDLKLVIACLLMWVRWIPQGKGLLTLIILASLFSDFFSLKKHTSLCN